MKNLIDTTEMYLKIVFEMEEDGIVPLRARIVDRLGHSGPTVSQTVTRMERDGLLHVARDRRIQFTDEGKRVATDVIRKHRLSELLLQNVIGLGWANVHEEACGWEHVMSDEVAKKITELFDNPQHDPYGNRIPGSDAVKVPGEQSVLDAIDNDSVKATIIRLGEPVQAEIGLLGEFVQAGIQVGSLVEINETRRDIELRSLDSGVKVGMLDSIARHVFVTVS